jgi:uncharacterized SAM-binding protein YcdF (DUF218 family)
VLGAAVWPGGQPSPTLAARARHGASLALADPDALLVLTGGTGRHPPAEAVVAAAIARGMGVASARILLDDRSTRTVENLANARALLAPLGIDRVTIVSDAVHLPRAWAAARILGLRARVSASPGDGPRPMFRLRMALREAAALLPTLIRAARLRRDAGRD